jgi:hypothetical protein
VFIKISLYAQIDELARCHFLNSWLLVKEAGFLKALPVLVLHQH